MDITTSIVPSVTLTSDKTIIEKNGPITLTWISVNGSSCFIEPGIGSVGLNDSLTVTPLATTTYVITTTNPQGIHRSSQVTVTVIDSPTVTLVADKTTISHGESINLSWTSANAQSCKIMPVPGAVALSGTEIQTPEETTEYTITAIGPLSAATAKVRVNVAWDNPNANLSPYPATIDFPGAATLTWSTQNASLVSINQGVGSVPVNGSVTVRPTETTTYTLTASNPEGETITTQTIVSVVYKNPKVIQFSLSESEINHGENVTLSWNVQNSGKIFISNGIGEVAATGSMELTPDFTTTYSLTAYSPNGVTSEAKASVKVLENPPAPLMVGLFGKMYESLIPDDASLAAYDEKRFVVITGIVNGMDGNPLSDVRIEIIDHPEYGTTLTDETGRFSIPCEGGGLICLIYTKNGFITSHRQKETTWNDIVVFDTITMIQEDEAFTYVVFNGDSDTVITHKSTEIIDIEFGKRSCTLIFTGDNMAYEVDENGNRVRVLPAISTRATEFTTIDSMPAVLPPNSAYTYCAELKVDGADNIEFDKPVTMFVDNFLGFPVGGIVPVGYYDRLQNAWVPSKNGVVVKLLDTDSDGIVDALDATGNGVMDDLDGDGYFADEVEGLEDSTTYLPGATYWRVIVDHFTPYDCNWPFGNPPDAIIPNPLSPPVVDQQQKSDEVCNRPINSYVSEQNRVFHEDIDIPGTDMTLHYASNRVKDYHHIIDIPASGPTVPASLRRIDVKAEIAGVIFDRTLEALPEQKTSVIWDGKDYKGNKLTGTVNARISVGFVYPALYFRPWTVTGSDGKRLSSFGQPGGPNIEVNSARQEFTIWSHNTLPVQLFNHNIEIADIAEGWSLSSHHKLSPSNPSVLLKGDGTTAFQNGASAIIDTVAGNGSSGTPVDGVPAIESSIEPWDVAVDSKGNLYMAERLTIRKVDTNGIITTFAGNGSQGHSGDGGPAKDAQFMAVTALAIDSQDNLYIVDGHYYVRKINTNGIITTVAGNGIENRVAEEGALATETPIYMVQDIAVDSVGNLFIAEDGASHSANRVRKVDINGRISTIAGEYVSAFQGNNGPAINAKFISVLSIDVDQNGNLYVADFYDNQIRKISKDGIITAFAGASNGYNPYGAGFSGDGGLATEAKISLPSSVTVDPYGNVYFLDSENRRIRKVDTSGIISTIAGNGVLGFSGDGGAPINAEIFTYGMKIGSDVSGNLYMSYAHLSRIRKISKTYNHLGSSGIGDITFFEENGQNHIMSASGRHRRTVDAKTGKTLRDFSYEGSRLKFITDQFGKQVEIRWLDDNTAEIISPYGLVTSLTVDDKNHLQKATYPDGSYYEFGYSDGGLMTHEVDPEQNRFDHVFDNSGRLKDVFDPEGGQWNYSRNTLPNGDVETVSISGEGNATRYLDHTFSTGRIVSEITDPSGDTTLYEKSAEGLEVYKTLPCGMTIHAIFDLDNEYKYQIEKNITKTTESGLSQTTTRNRVYEDRDGYNGPDLFTETEKNQNKTTTHRFDVLSSIITVVSPANRTITSVYNPDTLQTERISITGLNDVEYEYYPAAHLHYGKLHHIRSGLRESEFIYYNNGNLHTATDSEGNITVYEQYDAMGRIKDVKNPDGTHVLFDYDKNGNMTSLTTPAGRSHIFGFNGVDMGSSYLSPLGMGTIYTYDNDRRPVSVLFPSGAEIIYDYNDGNGNKALLQHIITPEGSIDYTYSCNSKIESVASDSQTVSWTYDGLLVTSETNSGELNQTLTYSYNNDGNFALDGFNYAGENEAYMYDLDGLLTGSGPFTITRKPENGLPTRVSGGSYALNRDFNAFGETNSETFTIGGSSIGSWQVTQRDQVGRILEKTETLAGSTITYAYSYDENGRLLTVNRNGTLTEEYRYDGFPFGNCSYRTSTLRGTVGEIPTYDSDDRMTGIADRTYSYDDDGHLTQKVRGSVEQTLYHYSTYGELLNVTLPNGDLIEYIHDPMGRRRAVVSPKKSMAPP